MSVAEAVVTFRCDDGDDGCGITFVTKPNYAGKIRRGVHRQLCSRCARDALRTRPKEAPGPRDLIFWLERFSDEDIVEFAWYLFGEEIPQELIAASREALLGQQIAAAVA